MKVSPWKMTYKYKPIPPAVPYHKAKERNRILVCGARSGKTRAVIGGEAILDAILQPGYYRRDIEEKNPYGIIVTEPTFKMIKRIAWPLLLKATEGPLRLKKDLSTHSLLIKGIHGISQIDCATYEQGSSKIEGVPQYRAFCDECFQMPEGFYHEIITRLTDRKGRLTLIGTPKPTQWLMDIIQLAKDGDPDFFFTSWKTEDNPYFPKSELDLLKRILPAKIYQRNFEAALDSFIGQMYEVFSKPHHVKSFDINPNEYEFIWGSMDWGYSHYGSMYIYGLRHDDKVDIIHEVSERGLEIMSHVEGVRTWASILLSYQQRYDEIFDYFEAGPDRPENIAALDAMGIRIHAADNDVMEGIQFCAALMHIDANGNTKLRIHKENCPKLPNKIQMMRWAENADGSLSEKQLKKDDDECDSMRYGLFSQRKSFRFWGTIESYLKTNSEG